MKKTVKRGIKWSLWAASAVGVFTIFGDGYWKLIGVASVVYMLVSTICTAIDENRDEA